MIKANDVGLSDRTRNEDVKQPRKLRDAQNRSAIDKAGAIFVELGARPSQICSPRNTLRHHQF